MSRKTPHLMENQFWSEHKEPVCNFWVRVCIPVILRLVLGLLSRSLQGLQLGGHFMTFVVRISRQK